LTVFLALGSLLAIPETAATDINGSARVYTGRTESDGFDQDLLDQRYSLTLFQPLSPWTGLYATYRYHRFDSDSDQLQFYRKTSEPVLTLTYGAPTFDMRLTYRDQRFRGTFPNDNLDIRSFTGYFSWRPHVGPSYTLTVRDDHNVSDIAVFGRDNDLRNITFETLYTRRTWEVAYNFLRSELTNNLSGLEVDQDRHIVRVDWGDRWWDDRFTLSGQVWGQRIYQQQVFPSGSINQPLPPREGLFAEDTTPETSTLDPSPELIDGDTTTPVTPRIEIGGAATFRNIGLDLGITRQVTRLDISVDTISGANVLWGVYISTDNQSWVPITGVLSTFDVNLLRYELEFPETTARYFKAVNLSLNSQPVVAVTEMRAFLSVQALARTDEQSDNYRVTLFSNFNPHERVESSFTLEYREDEDVGTLSRVTQQATFAFGLRVRLTRELKWFLAYNFADVDESISPGLQSTERRYHTGLEWSPLPTVNGRFSIGRWSETQQGSLIRETDTARVRFLTAFFPTLDLVSDVSYSNTDDPFAGFTQINRTWVERLQTTLTPEWTLGASVRFQWVDSTGTVDLFRRRTFQLYTRWQAAPYLTLTGDWRYNLDDDVGNLNQRYSVAWTPGRKLSMTVSYQDTRSDAQRRTTVAGVGVNYKLNRMLRLWATSTYSSTEFAMLPLVENTSGRIGLDLFF